MNSDAIFLQRISGQLKFIVLVPWAWWALAAWAYVHINKISQDLVKLSSHNPTWFAWCNAF